MQRPRKLQPGNENTTRLQKPRLFPQKKSTTISNINSGQKIMLTDLCPQQKAKIGELIKTLQQRKKQNQELTQQLCSWKESFVTVQKMKGDLQVMIDSRNKEIHKLSQQLQKLTKQSVTKDIELRQVRIQLEKYEQKSRVMQLRQSTAVNTVNGETFSRETQTKEKQRKLKDREVQVSVQELQAQNRHYHKNNFYQPNSKSFDKIMKQERAKGISGQKDNELEKSFGENIKIARISKQSLSQQILNDPQLQSRLRPQELQQNSHKNWSQYDSEQGQQHQRRDSIIKSSNRGQIQVEDTQNDDDQFQMLARKWLQLKEKNIQQLSQGWANQGINENIITKNENIPITKKTQQKQKPPLTISLNNRAQNQHHLSDQEQLIDENQLNRALKSRQFSASRLLNNSRSRRNASQNSDKKSLQKSQPFKQYESKQKQKYQGRNIQNSLNLAAKKTAAINDERNMLPPARPKQFMQNSISRGVDFYSSDLMDLVEEINK